MTREMQLYGNKVYGFEVSSYGLENGYLDYGTLAKIVGDCILNNTLIEEIPYGWELVNGDDLDDDSEYYEIYQWYIIDYHGYRDLARLTDEIVYYNEQYDLYLWGITHFGTAWSHVLTDIKLV